MRRTDAGSFPHDDFAATLPRGIAAFTPSCLVKTAQPLFADVQAVEVPVFFGAGSGIFA
jgi:hypothetical protein